MCASPLRPAARLSAWRDICQPCPFPAPSFRSFDRRVSCLFPRSPSSRRPSVVGRAPHPARRFSTDRYASLPTRHARVRVFSRGIRARVFACFQMRLSPHYRSQCACPMSTQSVRRCDRTYVTARFLRIVLPCLHAAGVCVSVSVVPCYHNICVTSSPSSTVIVPGPCCLRCHISRRLCARSS